MTLEQTERLQGEAEQVISADLYNIEGEKLGEIELAPGIFGRPVNTDLLTQVVNMQLANRRSGTAKAKTRSEVRGGGAKPWRQKGTGRARHGTIRSPLWVGGGKVFPPQPRDYRYKVPKKQRREALRSALSSKADTQGVLVLEEVVFSEPKTKEVTRILNNLKLSDKRVLIVTEEYDINLYKSVRNISGVEYLHARNLNVYDVLNYETMLITKDGLVKLEEVLS